ncbi:uncharacterized protein LOC117611975 [Osmia lignaria lignaria]|uniref:uncharacterized protein LOC117611975 n=1 Tax=Osmia lignaria lignaria TaxID=1437193 RepID=UPI00402BBC74
MCIMEKDRKRKFDSGILSNSYREGIGRVLGVKGHMTYELPPETIKERQIFWENFFLEYSEQLSDDIEFDVKTFELCSRKYQSPAVDKRKSIVQHWVNTSYLPYQTSIHKIGYLENNHFSIERGLNMSYTKPHCNESFLSSSVDTAAYILSNTNTTNKADTMVIVEGAKHDNLENVSDITYSESTEISKIADIMHENNGENNTRDNNNSNRRQHSPVTTEIMTCTVPQQNIDTQENVDMLDQALNTKSPSPDNCESYSCKLSNKVSTPEHSKESYLRRSLLDCSAIKIRHRKKLYTGRDSPVDLITMEHSHKEVLCKLTQHIHPALNFKYPLQKKRNIRKKRSFKHWMVNKSLMNSTLSISDSKKSDEVENIRNYSNRLSSKLYDLKKLDDAPCANREILSNSNNTQDLNKCSENQSINMSRSSQPVSRNHKRDSKNNELNDKIIQSEKVNTRASDTFSNFKQSTSSNSVIRTVDSRKHKKKSNKIMNDPKNLNPVIALTRLSNLDILKYKKLKNYSHNLHPVVCLKRLSESEIQKYKRPTNMMKDKKYLNTTVSLKTLSEATIKRYKTAHNMKTRSKTDLLSDTVKLSDSSMNRSQLSLRNKANGLKSPSNIINVGSCDTDSNQSTILICKCNSKTSDNASLSNVVRSSKKLAEFSSPVVETCSNSSRLKLSEINKNFNLRKDITDRQSIDNILNTSINSQNYICNRSSSRKSKTSKNGYSDNVHTTIDKKLNPKHRRTNREKLNVTKEQDENGRNNLIEGGICNTIVLGKHKSEKQAVVKNLIKTLYNGKTKKNKNKFNNANRLHFETRLYDSDSELTSDSEFHS